jgi:FtsP/CotA-like multicopper oxidase with cupredoxin domain
MSALAGINRSRHGVGDKAVNGHRDLAPSFSKLKIRKRAWSNPGRSAGLTVATGRVRQRSRSCNEGRIRQAEITRNAEAPESRPRSIRKEPPGHEHWNIIGNTAAPIALSLLLFTIITVVLGIRSEWLPFHTLEVDQRLLPHSPSIDPDRLLHPQEHIWRSSKTISLQWRISSCTRAPDGVSKRVYLINGDFPGPTVEARSGDTIEIEVTNDLKDEGVAVHFHGLFMRGFNEMDGAVGITQDPIPPGGSLLYRFNVSEDQHGTFWYHAHSLVQRGDGVFGALIVHRPAQRGEGVERSVWRNYDEERLLMVNDWYHRSAEEGLSWYMRSGSFGMEPVPDSMLANGIGMYNCSNAVPARPVKCSTSHADDVLPMAFNASKTYRLRIINSGMLGGFSFTISGAVMTVVEVDGGVPVEQRSASSVGTLYPGQRIDVILSWTAKEVEPALAISLDESAFRYPNPALTASQSFPVFLDGNHRKSSSADCEHHVDLLRLRAASAIAIPQKADKTLVLYTTTLKLARLSNIPHGFINQTTWSPQSPPLLNLSRSSYDKNQLVPFVPLTTPPTWIDIILNNLDDDAHPFHLHGYSPYVLATYGTDFGWGSWNPFSGDEPPGGALETDRPVRRDTILVPRRGYAVLRFRADNSGVWLFHCHVLWHLGSGMAMAFEVGS